MKIGFTGTQHGMSYNQREQFAHVVLSLILPIIDNDPKAKVEFHDGMCVGSDQEAHEMMEVIHTYCKLIGHPGVDRNGASPKRAARGTYDEIREPQYYTDRNKTMVDEISVLIAAPAQDEEVLRSGTWQTIRYARSLNRRIIQLRR